MTGTRANQMSKLDKDSLKALLVQAKPTLVPLAVLMVLYTLFGLWLLAAPNIG